MDRHALPANHRENRDASWMFNGRLNPVIPCALRGAIWNQGYAKINGGIRGWRMKWNQPALQARCTHAFGNNAVFQQGIRRCGVASHFGICRYRSPPGILPAFLPELGSGVTMQ
jgi:hypothetical protein